MKKKKWFTRQVNHGNLQKRKMTILLRIQPQHPRLATRVGFNWETSDSVAINRDSSDSGDESEPLDENAEVHKYACIRTYLHTQTHNLCT